MINILLVILIAYLIGSIPFSHIFPRIKGKDVRRAGTRNVGASNALVVAGPILGILALIGDIAKGYLAVSIAHYYSPLPWVAVAAGLAAVIGHDFSIFLRFKGGKGVATTGGALMAFDLVFAVFVLLLWILLILISRYFIPSTLIILGMVPCLMWVLGLRREYIIFSALAFGLALYTHRRDIVRIVSGRELKTSEAVKHYLKK